MKDPTSEILTALVSLVGTVTGFQVLTDLPQSKIYNYVLISILSVTDSITGDTWESDCIAEIKIVSAGSRHVGKQNIINTASNAIMQAITKKALTMTSFTTGVYPYLVSNFNSEYTEGNEIINQKILTYEFSIKQN